MCVGGIDRETLRQKKKNGGIISNYGTYMEAVEAFRIVQAVLAFSQQRLQHIVPSSEDSQGQRSGTGKTAPI